MHQKRILAVHDISCVGRCSLTVALPIISSVGIECSVLPTAVLSTHTGGFGKPHVRDLTADLPAILDHWRSNDISFDTICSGYLGSIREIELMQEINGFVNTDLMNP